MTTILDCGHEPTPNAGCGTGYATARDTGKRSCYSCAEELERADMATAKRFSAYLSSDNMSITTWTGGKLGRVTRMTRNDRQTFVRVTDIHGKEWAGIGPAENGTYVSLRRVAS